MEVNSFVARTTPRRRLRSSQLLEDVPTGDEYADAGSTPRHQSRRSSRSQSDSDGIAVEVSKSQVTSRRRSTRLSAGISIGLTPDRRPHRESSRCSALMSGVSDNDSEAGVIAVAQTKPHPPQTATVQRRHGLRSQSGSASLVPDPEQPQITGGKRKCLVPDPEQPQITGGKRKYLVPEPEQSQVTGGKRKCRHAGRKSISRSELSLPTTYEDEILPKAKRRRMDVRLDEMTPSSILRSGQQTRTKSVSFSVATVRFTPRINTPRENRKSSVLRHLSPEEAMAVLYNSPMIDINRRHMSSSSPGHRSPTQATIEPLDFSDIDAEIAELEAQRAKAAACAQSDRPLASFPQVARHDDQPPTAPDIAKATKVISAPEDSCAPVMSAAVDGSAPVITQPVEMEVNTPVSKTTPQRSSQLLEDAPTGDAYADAGSTPWRRSRRSSRSQSDSKGVAVEVSGSKVTPRRRSTRLSASFSTHPTPDRLARHESCRHSTLMSGASDSDSEASVFAVEQTKQTVIPQRRQGRRSQSASASPALEPEQPQVTGSKRKCRHAKRRSISASELSLPTTYEDESLPKAKRRRMDVKLDEMTPSSILRSGHQTRTKSVSFSVATVRFTPRINTPRENRKSSVLRNLSPEEAMAVLYNSPMIDINRRHMSSSSPGHRSPTQATIEPLDFSDIDAEIAELEAQRAKAAACAQSDQSLASQPQIAPHDGRPPTSV